MSDIVERLRAYNMGDFDTSAVLTKDCVSFADVPLIRDASDLVEVIHDAASEIARLRADLAAARADLALARERKGATGLEYRGG